jgi:peptide/nickel transport system permease protein
MLLSLGLAVLAARTGWLPIGGMRGALVQPGVAAAMLDVAFHLVMPALALAIPVGALFERLQSRALASTLREPCFAAAATRGVPVWRRHLLYGVRLALTPVASLFGVVAGSLLGGSFAVEIVTVSRDLYLVAGCATVGAFFVAASTLLTDLVAAWNDPRLREGVVT